MCISLNSIFELSQFVSTFALFYLCYLLPRIAASSTLPIFSGKCGICLSWSSVLCLINYHHTPNEFIMAIISMKLFTHEVALN